VIAENDDQIKRLNERKDNVENRGMIVIIKPRLCLQCFDVVGWAAGWATGQ